jgi:hypothetical protein
MILSYVNSGIVKMSFPLSSSMKAEKISPVAVRELIAL